MNAEQWEKKQDQDAERLANARLIAAAPELLAALEAAFPLLVRLGDFIANQEGRCEAVLLAHNAIKKAREAESCQY